MKRGRGGLKRNRNATSRASLKSAKSHKVKGYLDVGLDIESSGDEDEDYSSEDDEYFSQDNNEDVSDE